MTTKHVTPFVGAAFNCPHCGALAHQTWFKGYVAAYKEGDYPTDVPDDFRANIRTWDCDDESKANLAEYCEQKRAGRVFTDSGENKFVEPLVNFDLTKCFSCREFSLWIVRRLIYPANDTNVRAHPDMPSDLVGDFEEAARISRISPRGSAALLRLCVQKLCMHLGGKGKDINADVALLVKNGLSVRVQRALDVVRVIGNNAVHPGKLDLRDDFAIANKLFELVNIIVDSMIAQPNTIDALFGNLPGSALEAIEKRDGATDLNSKPDAPTQQRKDTE